MKEKLEDIRIRGEKYSLLYVEDNEGLRNSMAELLSRVFPNYELAEDGADGLEHFKQTKHKIVVTDLVMPNMDGYSMLEHMKLIDPFIKILVVSAHNDSENLMRAINMGVFRYIPKPVKLAKLVDALHDTVMALEQEEEHILFESQIQDVFNYQTSLVAMFKEGELKLVNQRYLDFFGKDSIEELDKKEEDIDQLFLEHKEFLYSTPEQKWFDVALENEGKLFNVKMSNAEKEARHMIMKLRRIPERDQHVIISLDDVTELNLMSLFDKESADHDKMEADHGAVIKMMKVVYDNAAELKLHNFYKGLTIIHSAVLVKVTEEEVILKTSFSQLKIIEIAKHMTISSEVFPADVVCHKVNSVDFDMQTVSFSKMQFMQRTATDRELLRLEPEPKHTISLFYHDTKFFGDILIVDISLRSIKAQLNALPAGLKEGETVKISLVLPTGQQPLNITTEAEVYRVEETTHQFYLVLLFELSPAFKERLNEYMYHRQLALIREFKALGSS